MNDNSQTSSTESIKLEGSQDTNARDCPRSFNDVERDQPDHTRRHWSGQPVPSYSQRSTPTNPEQDFTLQSSYSSYTPSPTYLPQYPSTTLPAHWPTASITSPFPSHMPPPTYQPTSIISPALTHLLTPPNPRAEAHRPLPPQQPPQMQLLMPFLSPNEASRKREAEEDSEVEEQEEDMERKRKAKGTGKESVDPLERLGNVLTIRPKRN